MIYNSHGEGKQRKDGIEARLDSQLKKIEEMKNFNMEFPQYQGIFTVSTTGEIIHPSFNPQTNYSEQFWKLYYNNQRAFKSLSTISDKFEQLKSCMKNIENLEQEYRQYLSQNMRERRKNRRNAVEIEKNHMCPYPDCYREYGSDVSLNLHIKLKHNGGNKTQRQKLADMICIAEEQGRTPPEVNLTFPPHYLDDHRKKYYSRRLDKLEKKNEKSEEKGQKAGEQLPES